MTIVIIFTFFFLSYQTWFEGVVSLNYTCDMNSPPRMVFRKPTTAYCNGCDDVMAGVGRRRKTPRLYYPHAIRTRRYFAASPSRGARIRQQKYQNLIDGAIHVHRGGIRKKIPEL